MLKIHVRCIYGVHSGRNSMIKWISFALVGALMASAVANAAIDADVTTSTDANTYNSPDELCRLVNTYWSTYRPDVYCGSVEIVNGCPTWQQLNTWRDIKVAMKSASAPTCPSPATYSIYSQGWFAKCPANSTYDLNGGCNCPTGYREYLGQCVALEAYVAPKNNGANTCHGDPCNPTTAQQFEREVLFQASGTQGDLLSLILSYNSTHHYIQYPQWTGSYGHGWISKYESRIKEYSPSAAPGAAPATVGVLRSDGREFQFKSPASGNLYVADSDISAPS